MFIQQSIVGGRVMTANDKKIIIHESDTCEIDVFDQKSFDFKPIKGL